jgi:hypothetical protein
MNVLKCFCGAVLVIGLSIVTAFGATVGDRALVFTLLFVVLPAFFFSVIWCWDKGVDDE